MIRRYYITLGATTTAGGAVISASHVDTIDGAGVAVEGDKVYCEQCKAEGVIALDGPRLSEQDNGREVALGDDLCLCNCSPPPRLVARQSLAFQLLDGAGHAASIEASAAQAAMLNASAAKAAEPERAPLLLRDLDTKEPFRQRPYRLQLADKVIEGTLDHNGMTRPLTAAERASVLAWHVDSGDAPA